MQRTGKYLIILLLIITTEWIWAEDKAFKRKDIADPHKKLEIREGDLTDTKKLLRKTESLSKTHIKKLRKDTLKAIGKKAYVFAVKNTPSLFQNRLKYSWLIMQLETEQDAWDRRKKRDAERSGGKLTERRQRDYDKKYSKSDEKIKEYRDIIDIIDQKMILLSKKSTSHQSIFSKTTTGASGSRLTDQFGNFIANLKKGEEVMAKNHTKDTRYYEIQYEGKIVYSLKEYFID